MVLPEGCREPGESGGGFRRAEQPVRRTGTDERVSAPGHGLKAQIRSGARVFPTCGGVACSCVRASVLKKGYVFPYNIATFMNSVDVTLSVIFSADDVQILLKQILI